MKRLPCNMSPEGASVIPSFAGRLAIAVFLILSCVPAHATTSAPDNPLYDNSDLLISSVFDKFQYPYPVGAVENPNTHRLDFTNSQSSPTSAWKDEIRYEAAYKFCSHLMPSLPKPPVGSTATLTLDDVRTISAARGDRALRAVVSEICFAAVDYRTACPASSMSPSKPMTPPQYGLGIQNIGDPEAASALADCENSGLSPAMYDYIFAHKCDDANYAQHLGQVLQDPATVEHVSQFECQETKDDFDAQLSDEKQTLVTALQSLLMMRHVGTPVNSLARPATASTPSAPPPAATPIGDTLLSNCHQQQVIMCERLKFPPMVVTVAASAPGTPGASNLSNVTSMADALALVAAGGYLGANSQCASLTKALDPSLGAASTWTPGQQVQGNTNIPVGTPIATFNYTDQGNGYGSAASPGGVSGDSHTGIYLGQSAAGVQMLNQWSGSGGATISTIPWSAWNGNAAEGGSKYYTIASKG